MDPNSVAEMVRLDLSQAIRMRFQLQTTTLVEIPGHQSGRPRRTDGKQKRHYRWHKTVPPGRAERSTLGHASPWVLFVLTACGAAGLFAGCVPYSPRVSV